MNNIQEIKQIIAKIDIEKIKGYLKEHSASKTLREIINYSKKILENNDEETAFRLGIKTAYNLDNICNPEKNNYVKDETEKKHWLEISEELFKNTKDLKK